MATTILIIIYLLSAGICCWVSWANHHILDIWLEEDSKPTLMYFVPFINTLNALVWLVLFFNDLIKGEYKQKVRFNPTKPCPTLKEMRLKKLKKLNKNWFSFK